MCGGCASGLLRLAVPPPSLKSEARPPFLLLYGAAPPSLCISGARMCPRLPTNLAVGVAELGGLLVSKAKARKLPVFWTAGLSP